VSAIIMTIMMTMTMMIMMMMMMIIIMIIIIIIGLTDRVGSEVTRQRIHVFDRQTVWIQSERRLRCIKFLFFFFAFHTNQFLGKGIFHPRTGHDSL